MWEKKRVPIRIEDMHDSPVDQINVYLDRLNNPALAERFRSEIKEADTKQRKIIIWELEQHNYVWEYYNEQRKKGVR